MKELGLRVASSLVAAPIALGAIWVGGAPLATLAALLAALGAAEFYRLARAGGSSPLGPLGVVLAALLPIVVHAHLLGVVVAAPAWGVLTGLLVLASAIWVRGVQGQPLAATAITVFGVLYTSASLAYVYGLRYHPYAVGETAGALLVIVPVVLTWASDVGAYVTGRLIGGRKLIPSVSPGKTVAGAVGALVTTVAAAWVLTRWVLVPYAQLGFSPTGLVLVGVLVSLTAQVGDLAESLLKREAGVKDSGTLLPGHGGVLDRMDSIYFVLPMASVLYDLFLLPAPGGR